MCDYYVLFFIFIWDKEMSVQSWEKKVKHKKEYRIYGSNAYFILFFLK